MQSHKQQPVIGHFLTLFTAPVEALSANDNNWATLGELVVENLQELACASMYVSIHSDHSQQFVMCMLYTRVCMCMWDPPLNRFLFPYADDFT